MSDACHLCDSFGVSGCVIHATAAPLERLCHGMEPSTPPPAPSPYRFTVSVSEAHFSGKGFIHVLVETPNEDESPEHLWFMFPSLDKAKADAAQVLAALHQATMEETP